RERSALWSLDTEPRGFEWIDPNDAAGNVFSFVRIGSEPNEPPLVCVANFSPVPHERYRLGLPSEGTWVELLNTDAEVYSGSGVGNMGAVQAVAEAAHGRPASATMRIPPLGTVWFTKA